MGCSESKEIPEPLETSILSAPTTHLSIQETIKPAPISSPEKIETTEIPELVDFPLKFVECNLSSQILPFPEEGVLDFTQEFGWKIHTFHYPTTVDPPKGVVAMIHGWWNHSNVYGHQAKALSEAGYLVYAYDVTGLGQSEGPRGSMPDDDETIRTAEKFVTMVQDRHDNLPLVLMGHSTGGLIVSCLLVETDIHVEGAVLLAPATEYTIQFNWAFILAPIFPTITIMPAPTPIEETLKDPHYSHTSVNVHSYMQARRLQKRVSHTLPDNIVPTLIIEAKGDFYCDGASYKKIRTGVILRYEADHSFQRDPK